jgi:hypothetical protein
LKALEAEDLARTQSKPAAQDPPYDLSRLDLDELRALRSLLTKAATVSDTAKAATTVDVALAALAGNRPQ